MFLSITQPQTIFLLIFYRILLGLHEMDKPFMNPGHSEILAQINEWTCCKYLTAPRELPSELGVTWEDTRINKGPTKLITPGHSKKRKQSILRLLLCCHLIWSGGVINIWYFKLPVQTGNVPNQQKGWPYYHHIQYKTKTSDCKLLCNWLNMMHNDSDLH